MRITGRSSPKPKVCGGREALALVEPGDTGNQNEVQGMPSFLLFKEDEKKER